MKILEDKTVQGSPIIIKGKEILATSYKDAIKKYNHKYK